MLLKATPGTLQEVGVRRGKGAKCLQSSRKHCLLSIPLELS